MRKLSLLAAAAVVMAWAGNAQAQATPDTETINATATIAPSLTLDCTADNLIDCGTVSTANNNTQCAGTEGAASCLVDANTDWALQLKDNDTTNTQNPTGGTGTEGVGSIKLTGGANSNDHLYLTTTVTPASGFAGIDQSVSVTAVISDIGTDDDYGTYNGNATLTLSEF